MGDIKNRWKTGNIQGADIKEICKEDLEELKRGPGLKDRFKERNESDEDVKQIRQWDQNEIDKSSMFAYFRKVVGRAACLLLVYIKISSVL